MIKLVGLSVGDLQRKYGDIKALEIAANAGADSVDLDLCTDINDYRNKDSLYIKGFEATAEYYTAVKKRADELGIIIGQTHGKIKGFVNNKAEDDALVKNSEYDCFATAILGAGVCVVHNATSIFLGPDPEPALMHRLSFDMFSRILPFAAKNKIKIATETFGDAVRFSACDFFGNIGEFEKAYNAVAACDELKEHFTVCVDTGHSNKAMRYGNPTPADVIRRLGKALRCFTNDNDTLTDQHKIPKTGCIDWNGVMDALDEIGYGGIYNMELNLRHFGDNFLIETAEFAVKVMRNMLTERYGKTQYPKKAVKQVIKNA
ncbi:MAG: sugar phosphate isomerase/epimerase family protein [Oscillospiraceae bacterium]